MLVSCVKTDGYTPEELDQVVERHFAALHLSDALSPSSRVALKPNLLKGARPDAAITTHPQLAAAVVRWLRRRGVSRITLLDSPGGLYTPELLKGIYRAAGMELAAQEGAVLNMDVSYQAVSFPQGEICREFTLLSPLLEADLVINLPKLKTHAMTTLSGGVKNLLGCVPGLQKPELHFRFPQKERFAGMLVDLALLVAPQVTLLDGVMAMEGDGPAGGDPKYTGYTLASRDVFALDLLACRLIGLDPMEAATVAQSIRRGLCPPDPDQLEVTGDPCPVIPFRLPATAAGVDFTAFLPASLRRPARWCIDRLAAPRPVISRKDCIGCGRCAESCPPKAISLENRKARIDPKGCIRCYCCHEMCPVKAVRIRRLGLLRL